MRRSLSNTLACSDWLINIFTKCVLHLHWPICPTGDKNVLNILGLYTALIFCTMSRSTELVFNVQDKHIVKQKGREILLLPLSTIIDLVH